MAKGAGLASKDHVGGGMVPDGDYTLVSARTSLNTYNGSVPDGKPAILVIYNDGADSYEQFYGAGDNQHLIPREDGLQFDHPDGESEPKIYKGGAASLWLTSLEKAGHKFTGDLLNQFDGMRVTLESVAAPKGKTAENKDRSIPLISKILAVAGKKGAPVARPTPSKAVVGASTSASPRGASAAPTVAASSPVVTGQNEAATNGQSLDDIAIAKVQEFLLNLGEGEQVSRLKMATTIWMTAQKVKDPQAMALKKLVQDATWLEANSEAGGWVSDGNVVALA